VRAPKRTLMQSPGGYLSSPIGLRNADERIFSCRKQMLLLPREKARSWLRMCFVPASMRSLHRPFLCRDQLGPFSHRGHSSLVRQSHELYHNRERCLHPSLQRGCPQEPQGADDRHRTARLGPGMCASVTVSWTLGGKIMCRRSPSFSRPSPCRKRRRHQHLDHYQGQKTAEEPDPLPAIPSIALQWI